MALYLVSLWIFPILITICFVLFILVIISLIMNIEKLFWSKTRCDILKYLIFRRQGVSMRALESEIGWTFPAIKKQVDSLQEAAIILIDKDQNKWSITLDPQIHKVLRELFLFALRKDIDNLLQEHEFIIKEYYFGKVFGYNIETDIVIVYQNCEKELLEVLKEHISEIFRLYSIELAYVTFLSAGDWQKRYQLADRFVLSVLRVHS